MKKLYIVAITISISTLLAGCALFNKSEASPSVVSAAATVSPTQSVIPLKEEPTPSSSESASATPIPTATTQVAWPFPDASSDPVSYENKDKITVKYYDAVEDQKKTATYNIDKDSSAQTAMDAVNDVYIQKVVGADIKTNSIVFKDGNIYIDFTDSIYHLNMGSEGESAVLDSIADVYLQNVKGAKAVYFSVNGADYSTGHMEIGKDKPYKTK